MTTLIPDFTMRTSLHGRRLGIGSRGALGGNDKALMNPCVDAAITVAAEDTNVRAITIQLKDAEGNAINYACACELWVMADAAGAAFAGTGGSTGIEIGTNGALLAIVAKKIFALVSEADGAIDLTWTDTGTEEVALWLRLPSGIVVTTAAFANT